MLARGHRRFKVQTLALLCVVSFSPAILADTGSAEVESKQPSKTMQSAENHRVQMRLSGSSCLSCLEELNHKLRKFPGVSKVKIESTSNHLGFYGAAPTWWEATLTYDASQLPLAKLLEMIEHQGYHPYKVHDKSLTQ